MKKIWAKLSFLIAGFVVLALPAYATKPCPMPDCTDAATCKPIASWIAEGEITDIVNDYKPPMLDKDFAEFTLEITHWVQKPSDTTAPEEIRFKVGWCDNSKSLPEKTTGTFRFFGTDDPNSATPHYLYFEAME